MQAPEFWYPEKPGYLPVKAWPLLPVSALYDWGGRLKQWMASPYAPSVPVICVGNVTVGGTGKTPVTIAIVERLAESGRRPFVLTRGYGGSEKGPILVRPGDHGAEHVGDEPLLLSHAAPTVVSANRVAGAKLAEAEGADVIVMDDGFQNPSLVKTLSLIVVDGKTIFGNGRIVPAGPLREPVGRGLKRAHAVVVMGGDDTYTALSALDGYNLPIFSARLVPDADNLAALQGVTLYAFAGIGRPEKFFSTLTANGLSVAREKAFPDHHRYTQQDWKHLASEAAALGADLVTTDKDAVRLPQAVRTLSVQAEFDNPAGLDALLQGTISAT